MKEELELDQSLVISKAIVTRGFSVTSTLVQSLRKRTTASLTLRGLASPIKEDSSSRLRILKGHKKSTVLSIITIMTSKSIINQSFHTLNSSTSI